MELEQSNEVVPPDDVWPALWVQAVGREVREARQALHWSRRDVIARLSDDEEISVPTLGTYELGTRALSVERLRQITDVLGTTPSDVLARAERRLKTAGVDVNGWTIDLLAISKMDDPELGPLRRWAQCCLNTTPTMMWTSARLVRLNPHTFGLMAELCGLAPRELADRLPSPRLTLVSNNVAIDGAGSCPTPAS